MGGHVSVFHVSTCWSKAVCFGSLSIVCSAVFDRSIRLGLNITESFESTLCVRMFQLVPCSDGPKSNALGLGSHGFRARLTGSMRCTYVRCISWLRFVFL